MKKQQNEEGSVLVGYTRVTEFLTPYKNFDNISPEVLEQAAGRGDEVHRLCELYASNMLIEIPKPEVKPFFDSFKYWFDLAVNETLYTEHRIYHPKLLIAGQFDWLGTFKDSDDLVLCDWKTPALHDISWRMQMAAYRFLLRECMGIDVKRRISIRLDREGKPAKLVEYLDHDHDERLFLNQVEIYRCFNPVIR